MNKKIIFWSSVDASIFMSAIIKGIKEQGVDAEHKFLITSNDYRNATTFLSRLKLRLRMYILYPIVLGLNCIFNSEERIYIITTNTFYAPLIALLFSRKNQQVIHLVWDLFPDVIANSKSGLYKNILHKSIKNVVQTIINKSDINIFLGKVLLLHAKNSFIIESKTLIIPVGADNEKFKDFPPQLDSVESKIEILYCGNLGSMHEVDTIIEGLQIFKKSKEIQDKIIFSFCASGPKYEGFKKTIFEMSKAFSNNILLSKPLQNKEWIERMKKAQIALVTMVPGAENIVMPSKTYSAIAAGQAILAICPVNSDLANLIIEENCGWVITPGNLKEFEKVIIEIATNRELLFEKRKNAFLVGQTKYSNKAIGKEWIRAFDLLTTKS